MASVAVGRPLIRRVSWGALFAGFFVGFGSWLLLLALGAGVGLATFDPKDLSNWQGLGIGFGIWGVIAGIVSLFVAGWVAARLSASEERIEGVRPEGPPHPGARGARRRGRPAAHALPHACLTFVRSRTREARMARVEKSVEIERPLRMVYDQWTQFEEFPRFMEGVEEVHQLDDRTLRWKASIAGRTEEWDAEIVQQVPDQTIAWRHTRGAVNSGVVTFTPLEDGRCRLTLALEYDPQGVVENVGDLLGFVSRRVEGDLDRFKRFIEERGAETGAWRGEVKPTGAVTPDPSGHAGV